LRQAQKLESIGQLAAGIAHEINTPTQFVNDNTSFLGDAFEDYKELLAAYERIRRSVETGDVSEEMLKTVDELAEEKDVEFLNDEIPQAIKQSQEGLKRISKIVMAMKEFSHPGADEKTPIDINKAIETTINVSRNEWKYLCDIKTDLAPDLPLVSCLPGEINQVLLNLIVNAAHAIADVVGKSGDMGLIRIATRQDDDWVEIVVSDTGCGIPKEIQERIFDPFFTTKEVGKGSGQGLAIVYSAVVDKHGGSIDVQSEEGKGTTFIIRLPVKQLSPDGK
ncbi:MAG: histidine kinase, partial [Gammaproteobacteria bacterium]|nr:histidine kinase [Gammaproteobacteria bacterium]